MIEILVCEDDPIVQELLQGFLASEGYGVTVASDGMAGIKKLAGKKYALVISDIEMTPMDGITFLKTLREEKNMVPFIMITGHPEIDTYIQAINELGAFEYVQKPLDLDVLTKIIKRLTTAK